MYNGAIFLIAIHGKYRYLQRLPLPPVRGHASASADYARARSRAKAEEEVTVSA